MADVKTTGQLLEELEVARSRLAELERRSAEHDHAIERFRVLYEDNPSMYFTVDPQGTVLSVNRFGAEQLGYRAADLVGSQVLDVFHAEDRKAVAEQLRNCVSQPGRTFHWEFRKVHSSGRVMWVKEVARSVRGVDGGVVVLIVCEDITERKEVEESQRYREERFRALYEDNPSMYFTVDPEGTVLSVNRFGAEQLGYDAGQLAHRSVLDVFHADDREAVRAQLENCVGKPGRIFHWEFRKIRRDGSLMWVKEVARSVRDSTGGTVVLIVCEDITERKQAELALRQSRESYRSLYTRTPAMLHSIDDQLRIVAVSDHWLEHLGYRRDEVLGHRTTRFLTAESGADAESRIFPAFIRSGSLRDVPLQMVKKNGTVIDILLSAVADRDAEGRFVRSLSVVRDVTERKRAEAALRRAHDEMERRVADRTAELSRTVGQLQLEIGKRKQAQEELQESREHFRRLVETVHVIPWEADADSWDFTYVGPQAVKLLGYDLGRWFQQDFWTEHIHPEDRERTVRACRELSRGASKYEFEYRMIAADGRVVWFNDVVSVVREEGKARFLRGFMVDITARKHAEELLEKQRAFLRLVIDISPQCIFAKDREGRYTLANRAVADLFGTTPEGLVGKTDEEFSPDREQVDFFRKMDREVLEGMEERFIPEEPLTDARGNVHWMQTVKRPFVGEDGSPQVLGSSTDITARRRAEERLRESESAVRSSQKELRELTRKLLTAQEEESRRLAREMHDDLTQRLAALAIQAGKLEQELSSAGVAQGKLRGMKEEMARLSQDVHALSRQLHPSILEDLGLVDAVEAECTSFSEREKIPVRFEASEVPPVEREVGLCLYRIAQEALRNIAKHASAAEVSVSLRATDGGVKLTVSDRGVGFDPERTPRGRGVGLVSMAERAKMIRADLMVHSSPDEGTVIEVRAPQRVN